MDVAEYEKIYRENCERVAKSIRDWEDTYNDGFPSYVSGKTKDLYKKCLKLDNKLNEFIDQSDWCDDEVNKFFQMMDQRLALYDKMLDNKFNDYMKFVNTNFKS